jgi:hypothetical protein
VGHDLGLERLDRAGPLVEALALHAVLDATGEEDLHADADAHDRAAAGQPAVDDPVAARLAQARHAGGEGADARHEQPVGVHGLVVVTRYLDVGSRAREGTLGGADVAEAVVEDDDLLLRGAQFHTSSLTTPAARHIAAPIESSTIRPLGIFCLMKE